ncbi:hypothetical protein [Paraburkholderia megapolitana]|uniref:Uncharacterized protein n=1 Tax=Paraburkholderia megapolitana TaxID=420953 RepID=A0A1I3W9L2_9BURK|nr:hypothetical protein [Paraburkholderia megapolitana]SFK04205.1 hypothetical protein SAMN05192543_11727 [Paraburkholderia megapolitana]
MEIIAKSEQVKQQLITQPLQKLSKKDLIAGPSAINTLPPSQK